MLETVWGGSLIPFVRVVAIVAATLLALSINRRYTERLGAALLAQRPGNSERERRVKTLMGFLRKVITFTILVGSVMFLLPELGIRIEPVLAAAGIGGLALGFGAQSLIKDFFNGFFLLMENQVRVGDWVKIGQVSGIVEALNLRTTVLRDLDGVVHVVPNGSIELVSNYAREYGRAVVDVRVGYWEDVDFVMETLRAIGAELQADPKFGPLILEPLNVMGVQQFEEWAIVIRTRVTTVPLEQWNVARELRRRIKNRFDELGIRFPLPYRIVEWSPGAKMPFEPVGAAAPGPSRRRADDDEGHPSRE